MEALKNEINNHEDGHRYKDITIADLERAHLDKDGIIDGHVADIQELKNKLELAEQFGLNKDAIIQEHINSHNEKNNVLMNKESNFCIKSINT